MSQNIEMELGALEGELMEMQAEMDAHMEQQPMAQPDEEPEVEPEASASEAEEAAPEAEDAAPVADEQEPAAQEAEDAMQEEAEAEAPTAVKEPSQPAEGGKDSGKASIAIKKKPGFKPMLPKAKAPAATASPSKPSAATSSPSKTSAGTVPPVKPAAKPAVPKKKMVVARAVPAESVEDGEAAPASQDAAAEDVAEGSNKGEPKTKAKVLATKVATVKPAAAKPAAKPAAAKKPAGGGNAKGKGKAEDSSEAAAGSKPAAGPKKPKNAYMFFTEAKRAEMKEANSGVTLGELAKLMGEAWKQLSNEEKKPFQALADADKERYAAECASAGESGNKENKPAAEKKARAPKAAKIKTAYELFSEERKPALVAANPKASGGEIAKLLSVEYKELAEEEKAVYAAMHEDLKKAAPAAAPSKKRPAKAAAGSKGKRAKSEAAADSDPAEEMAPAADDEEEFDNEAAHENVDYDVGPAEYIIAKSKQGKYVVARRGMPFSAYGLVDAREAKMQRLGDSSEGKQCPVSLAMMEEFEAFEKSFRRAVHDNMVDGELEYEELSEGSKLECLNILARLRQPGFPLAAKEKDDIYMKVPLLATCKAVQRLIDIERQRAQEAQQRADAAEALLAAAQGQAGGNGKGAVEDTPRTKVKKGVEAER